MIIFTFAVRVERSCEPVLCFNVLTLPAKRGRFIYLMSLEKAVGEVKFL